MKTYIVIDIGGTAIKHGLMDESGKILEKTTVPSEADQGGPHLKSRVYEIIRRRLEAGSGTGFAGVAISTAGMVDPERGMIVFAGPGIPDYAGTAYKEEIEALFGLPCEIQNDVKCAGFAEYTSGAGRGSRSMVCLTIGTGIGGSVVVDGQVIQGAGGSAGEVGYMGVSGGMFERLGAASVLSKKVAAVKGGSPDEWNGIRIFEGVYAGDEDCIRAVDEMCEVLGEGISNICYVVNPEVVVLGGGIMAQKDYLIPRIRKALDRHLISYVAEHTQLRAANQGNDAGMIGACYHFIKMQEKRKAR